MKPSWCTFHVAELPVIPSLARAIYPVIPKCCCNQFWKAWLIYKQESTHIMLLHLFGAQREIEMNLRLADRETGLWAVGAVRETYCTSRRQPTVRWVSSTTARSLHAKHISSWFSRELARNTTTMASPGTYKHDEKRLGCWMTTKKGKYHNRCESAGCPNWRKRKGRGLAVCVILRLCGSEYSGK